MSIPNTVHNTPEAIIKYLEDKANEANDLWTNYAATVANAYASAYKRQVDLLTNVKIVQQAQIQADHELVTYVLSMFTVGVAGAAAGYIARRLAEGVENEINNQMVADGMKNVIQRAQQGPNPNDVLEMLDPYPSGSSADVFAPTGVTPSEYWSGLVQGISYYKALLTIILNLVKYNRDPSSVPEFQGTSYKLKSSGDRLTLMDARALAEAILNTSFFTDPPPLGIDGNKLKTKAELALWIGWAYARDPEYWSKAMSPRATPGRQCDARAYDEQFGWEDVRKELFVLGVPPSEITAYGTNYGWMGRTSPKTGLWMWGFMEWTTNPGALHTLFDKSLPKSSSGFERVKQRMLSRELTDQGWFDIDPKRFLSQLIGTDG
jgi:hypothetical protein